MALYGSAAANLSPILFKGNNRSLGVNVIIHQDKSESMDDVSQFYNNGTFIGELQEALLNENIGTDIGGYPNLYSYFGVYSRNPSSSFTITNPNGSLTINQAFMLGKDDKNSTTLEWTNNYINNSTSHVVNICTDVAGSTNGGRLSGYGNELGGGSPKSEDIHGSIWSIFTSPNAISTGTPGRYGSIISSNVRRGSTNIVITNSDEQENCPEEMIDQLVNSGGIERTINGPSGEVSFRNYRVFGLNSYNIPNYDGILYYGNTSSFPYGLVKFTGGSIYSITVQGPGGTATASVQITIQDPNNSIPTVNLSSPSESPEGYVYVDVGGSVTLNWTSTNATSVSSFTGTGFNPTTVSGTDIISNVTTDRTFTITVQGPNGTTTSNEIRVLIKSPTVNLNLVPGSVSPPIYTEVTESIYASGKYIFLSGYDPFINNYGEIPGKTYIHISDDGSSWEIIAPDVNDLLRDIAYDGSSTFVAVGTRACIVRTTDNWQTITNHSIPESSITSLFGNYEAGFSTVTYGNGKFVAISRTNLQIYTSTNGINWSSQSVNFSYTPVKIRYLNGYFYLVSSNTISPRSSKIYRSLDAITWTEVYSDSISSDLRNIIYDGTRFIAVGAVVLTSTNGTTWNLSLSAFAGGFVPTYVASDGNLIVLHSDAPGVTYYTSSDGGNTWTQRSGTNHNEGGPIIFDGSKFISLLSYPTEHSYKCRITTDGINWDYTNQSVKYKFDPSWGSLSIYSFPDSSGRYYSIDLISSGIPPIVPASISRDSTYITISNLNVEQRFEIVTRNSDSSLAKESSLYTGTYSITWSSSNATSVLSSSGTGFTPTALSGSTSVTGNVTETYSITVQNDSGETATATETLEIPLLNSSSPLPTISLSSDKSSVGIGETFNLTWSSINASTVSSVTGFGFIAGATSGSTLVTAGTNSTYSITVQSPSGTATSNLVSVTINAPTVTLTAVPISTDLIRLTWSSTNATTVISSIGSGFSPTEASGSIYAEPPLISLDPPNYSITRTSTLPNITASSDQLHDVITLASESRGGIFSIDNVFTNTTVDNRIAFSKCLAEFIADTV